MNKPYLLHLKSSKSLETTYEAYRAGFVALALERNRRATPFVAQARALKASAAHAKTPADLMNIKEIQPGLLTAAGVSDKAERHLQNSDQREAISGLIRNFLEPAGAKFVEELVFRFLLTRGDTLGGSMRNVGGFIAQCKLTRSIIAHLKLAGKKYCWLHSKAADWIPMLEDDTDIELHLRGLSWDDDKNSRSLLYNITPPPVQNNVDMCLFNCSPKSLSKDILKSRSSYIALGELKGGIDPAGADEHWKTARTALNRIRFGFRPQGFNPKTFFVGAAIEVRMASEIWSMLESGDLDNAANLTDDDQIASIVQWLCSL